MEANAAMGLRGVSRMPDAQRSALMTKHRKMTDVRKTLADRIEDRFRNILVEKAGYKPLSDILAAELIRWLALEAADVCSRADKNKSETGTTLKRDKR